MRPSPSAALHCDPMAVITARRRILIREMTAADLGPVRRIERDAYADAWPATTFEAELRNALATYLVAVEFAPGEPAESPPPRSGPAAALRRLFRGHSEQTGHIVGFAGAWITVDQLHIVTLAVTPSRQREGIGQWLLLECFAIGEQAGLRTVALEVRPSNERAIRLYERFGFRRTGRLKDYYTRDVEDAIVMLADDIDGTASRERLARIRREHAPRFDATEWRGRM